MASRHPKIDQLLRLYEMGKLTLESLKERLAFLGYSDCWVEYIIDCWEKNHGRKD